jgi:uncharacterized membrane-anchored protein YhcB (DUF1043 family)
MNKIVIAVVVVVIVVIGVLQFVTVRTVHPKTRATITPAELARNKAVFQQQQSEVVKCGRVGCGR